MSLLYSDMSCGRGTIGTFIDRLLCRFMLPCSKHLSSQYMWLYLTKSVVVSGQLHIITSRKYALKFDVPVQYKCCCNSRTFLALSSLESVK